MVKRTIPPAIRVVEGTETTSRDFGTVHSLPAAYIFNGEGKEVFRLGGDPGPNGRQFLRLRQLIRAIESIK